MLWGAGGLLELINSCCRCDIPLEKRKQPARLKTCFPSLMHPPGPLPIISPSALHQGIACFSNSVLMDFPYPHPCALESRKDGRRATMPAASGPAGQPALLELPPGPWAQRAHHSPLRALLATSCCRGVWLEGLMSQFCWESFGKTHSKGTGVAWGGSPQ